ncbi:hypothetical protein SHAb15599_00086 [Acinetobacter phage SH-Ab 15599]|nr:hypothetical protein SHAb15599_00086 [Acinetobacter phage SH-Ab 15599]
MKKYTLHIFEYKGMVAAHSDLESKDLIANSPLGIVVSTKHSCITQAAKDILKDNYKRGNGTFAPVMLTRHDSSIVQQYGIGHVALFGHGKHIVRKKDDYMNISRDCDLSILDELDVVEIETPADFIEFVDKQS